jgi:hypothetical protein
MQLLLVLEVRQGQLAIEDLTAEIQYSQLLHPTAVVEAGRLATPIKMD